MNPYDYYVTPEEYEQAEIHVISACLVNARIRNLAWSKKRAITTPPRQQKCRKELYKAAQKHGISRHQLIKRLSRGWDERRASTTPICNAAMRRQIGLRLCERNRKYPTEMIKLAENNGISYQCLLYRLNHGWDVDRATTLLPSYSNGPMRVKEIYGEKYYHRLMRWIFLNSK